ncbi:MAG: hypothetical protein COU09_00535 [Candidatus Harrisonbacteria bacterium CG10_big_fil_rev_8_21_14_0_10_44_23]|uniref:Dephospho-CoA kinase n=1 Tax=Candidatus Harrisonbacteria bacterium CG10_big_fil_rev_8_21_14_0_10_44_23 TaxID=1974585 RepID=A0A2H0UQU3_9BACT|nr:MAG: hypothetical protein COU09_00535 [Candidatus Harrisonbacteria bacterium CG10_big_fil_rev_8_21_14_0_10_44_23]
MIIGITGLNASGKDVAGEYLMSKGFAHFSCSDVIRDFCRKEGLELIRENLINKGNELREANGNGYLAEVLLGKIRKEKIELATVSSIRHPDEVGELKKAQDFYLLKIETPIEVRYSRVKKRGNERDGVSFEEFQKSEEKERTGSGAGQQLDKVMEMADYTIINDGSIQKLYENINKLLIYAKEKNSHKKETE